MALKILGQILSATARETDVCGRFGDDELRIVLSSTDGKQAKVFVERLNEPLKQDAKIGISIGMAETGPHSYESVDQLIERADQNMYEVKARNSVLPDVPRPNPGIAVDTGAPATRIGIVQSR